MTLADLTAGLLDSWREQVRQAIRAAGLPRADLRGLFVGISAIFYAADAAGCAEKILPKSVFLDFLEKKLQSLMVLSGDSSTSADESAAGRDHHARRGTANGGAGTVSRRTTSARTGRQLWALALQRSSREALLAQKSEFLGRAVDPLDHTTRTAAAAKEGDSININVSTDSHTVIQISIEKGNLRFHSPLAQKDQRLFSNLVLVHTFLDEILHDHAFVVAKRNWELPDAVNPDSPNGLEPLFIPLPPTSISAAAETKPAAEQSPIVVPTKDNRREEQSNVNGTSSSTNVSHRVGTTPPPRAPPGESSPSKNFVATWSLGFWLVSVGMDRHAQLAGGRDRTGDADTVSQQGSESGGAAVVGAEQM